MIQLAALSAEHQPVVKKIVSRLVERLVVAELGECWEWTGGINNRGYGKLRYRKASWYLHRFVHQHCIGQIPDELWVLHKCDNRKCCRPGHLFLGTCGDNIRDMHQKDRHHKWWTQPDAEERIAKFRGEKNPRAKLSDEQAEAARARVASGEKQSQVAHDLGVSRSLICMIVNRKIRAA